jgi:hypothetical protein
MRHMSLNIQICRSSTMYIKVFDILCICSKCYIKLLVNDVRPYVLYIHMHTYMYSRTYLRTYIPIHQPSLHIILTIYLPCQIHNSIPQPNIILAIVIYFTNSNTTDTIEAMEYSKKQICPRTCNEFGQLCG